MIKHIVCWKLKEEALGHRKDENAKQLKDKLEALNGQVEGALKIEVGLNFLPGGFDVCLYSEFESKEALDAYQVYPPHVEIKQFVKELACDRVAVDYEH